MWLDGPGCFDIPFSPPGCHHWVTGEASSDQGQSSLRANIRVSWVGGGGGTHVGGEGVSSR